MSAADEPEVEHEVAPPAPVAGSQDAETLQLEQTGKNGANWFFWIAALSLINTIVTHFGGDRHFIVGLAVTTIVDVLAVEMGKQHPESATLMTGIAVGCSLIVILFVVGFGWLSRKRILWVFGIGMGLYLLDGLVYLLLGDLMSAGFHGYALFSMSFGFRAFRQLARQDEEEIDEDDDEIDD